MFDRCDDRTAASFSTRMPVSFAQRMVASDGFRSMFQEGMALVEETASYLDGPGRQESRRLARNQALAYASESMRLTTRLMQLTSWLLLQRAVNEGELTRVEAEKEHGRIKVSPQDVSSSPELFTLLPPTLCQLVERSLRLQTRILLIDADLKSSTAPEARNSNASDNPVASQLNALQAALDRR